MLHEYNMYCTHYRKRLVQSGSAGTREDSMLDKHERVHKKFKRG